ncbi:MAG TPA: methyltransferase [Myxococcota bacterium]|nr:methyltransferase [Myxococcota bacterium]
MIQTDAAMQTPKLMQLIQNDWLLRAVTEAVRLGLFVPLADGGKSADALAQHCGLHAPAVARLLRALEVHGFVSASSGRYTLTSEGRMLLPGPHSFAPFLQLTDDTPHRAAWGAFAQTLKDGQSGAQHAFGKSMWAYLREAPASSRIFNQAMRAMTERQAVPVAKACELQSAAHVIDIGGGIGVFMRGVLEVYPHLKGGVFDLPHVEPEAKAYLTHAHMEERCEFLAGSFLEGAPKGADVYVIKNVLVDWGDDDVVRILRHVRAASRAGGRLIVSEPLMVPENMPWASLFDLQMLVMCEGGRAHGREDFERFFTTTGFALEKVVPVMDTHVIHARAA